MSRVAVLAALLGLIALSGCAGSGPLAPAGTPEVPRTTADCPDPGPAPGMPNWFTSGKLYRRGTAPVGDFALVSGPFLRTNADGCPYWFFGSHVTVRLNGTVRELWSTTIAGGSIGDLTFTEGPTIGCANPTGVFRLHQTSTVGEFPARGLWGFRDDGCGGKGERIQLRGRWVQDQP